MAFQYPDAVPQPRKSPINRTVIIIGALVLLMCGIAMAVGAAVMTFQPAASSGPTEVITYDVQTAREAYPPALELIRQEDPAAELVSAAGAWTPYVSQGYVGAGRTGWTFHFYLPSREQLARVVVDRSGKAYIAEKLAWNTPSQSMSDQGWTQDSPIATYAFMQRCQPDLAGHPDATVEARLSLAPENKRLLWQVWLLGPDQKSLCEIALDASTGAPLQ
jgi:hypothetical protein